MKNQDIIEVVRKAICECGDLETNSLVSSLSDFDLLRASFRYDLGLDSLDMLSIVDHIGEDLLVPEKSVVCGFETVRELIGECAMLQQKYT